MVHPAISSINLTTALGSLATIARQRPMFMSEVVQAYETLHGELFSAGLHTHSVECYIGLISVQSMFFPMFDIIRGYIALL